ARHFFELEKHEDDPLRLGESAQDGFGYLGAAPIFSLCEHPLVFVGTEVELRSVGHDLTSNERRAAVVARHTLANAEEPGGQLRAAFEPRQLLVDHQKHLLREVHHVGLANSQPPERAPYEVEM